MLYFIRLTQSAGRFKYSKVTREGNKNIQNAELTAEILIFLFIYKISVLDLVCSWTDLPDLNHDLISETLW